MSPLLSRLFAIALTLMCVESAPVAAERAIASEAAQRAELIAMDQAMQQAVVDRDVEAFAAFLSTDYVLIGSTGRSFDKAFVVANVTDPDTRLRINRSSNHQVHLYGDSAVVIADLEQKGVFAGQEFDIPVRYTDTWVRSAGHWICVSGHVSRLPQAIVASSTAAMALSVQRRDRQLNQMIIARDTERAAAFYADQFVLTTGSGKKKSKADLLREIGSPQLLLEVNETSEVEVRVDGETAILSGLLHQSGSYQGKSFDSRLRVTDTWIQRDGQWQIIAGHASAIQEESVRVVQSSL
jgi:ketosteroid isomerase-like protein